MGIQEAEQDVTRFLLLKDLAKVNLEENLITYRLPFLQSSFWTSLQSIFNWCNY